MKEQKLSKVQTLNYKHWRKHRFFQIVKCQSERIERKFKTQNPNLSSTWKKSGGSQKASSAEKKFTDFEFISEPFQCGVLKNIVENNDTGIFEELIKELEDVELSDKVRIFWEFHKTIKKFPTSDLTD